MRLFHSRAPRIFLAAAALAACSDRVSAPEPAADPPPAPVAALSCRADVRGGSVGCDASAPGGARYTLLGGQGTHVRLTSSDVRYDAATATFSALVTVQNLTAQAMGAEPGSAGVRVFFHSGPVATGGTGLVEVANAAGWGTFTGGTQPYFEYAGTLQPGEVSQAQRWEWSVPPSVESFSFTLFVSAGMQAPAPSSTLSFRSLSAGGQNVCGVTLGGDAYCWGHAAYGQLGAGTEWIEIAAAYRPVKVLGGPMDTVTVGEYGTCGLRGGEMWCWGSNQDAALGTWGFDEGCAPEHGYSGGCAAPTRSANGYTFRRITSGGAMNRSFAPFFGLFHCGIDASGKAFCWGTDSVSQLGDGKQYPIVNPFPVPVAGGITFAMINAGNDHSCGIDVEATAYCWGAEERGELGNDTAVTSALARPEPVLGGRKWRDVDAAHLHSCGVTTTGEAWCWGSNYMGQLGNATAAYQNCGDEQWPLACTRSPVRVESSQTFAQITTGEYHTCALTTAGEAWCWGLVSQVGRDDAASVNCTPRTDTPCVPTPVRVAADERFIEIEAGRAFTCALAENRKVWCWGTDSFGGTGQGRAGPVYVPRPIVGPAA